MNSDTLAQVFGVLLLLSLGVGGFTTMLLAYSDLAHGPTPATPRVSSLQVALTGNHIGDLANMFLVTPSNPDDTWSVEDYAAYIRRCVSFSQRTRTLSLVVPANGLDTLQRLLRNADIGTTVRLGAAPLGRVAIDCWPLPVSA